MASFGLKRLKTMEEVSFYILQCFILLKVDNMKHFDQKNYIFVLYSPLNFLIKPISPNSLVQR
jgi:hypothetical protein